MRRGLRILALLVVGSIIALSCNDVCSCKKESCPGYSNAKLDQWFPYQSNQQFLFADTAQQLVDDTVSFTDISVSSSYEANRGCYNGASGCSSNKYIFSPDLSINYSSFTDWNGTTTDSNYSFSLHDFSMNAKGISDTGFVASFYPSFHYNNITLNGKNYQNVQTIARTDTAGASYDVYQVYLQNGKGVIAWRSQYAKTLFILK